MAKSCNPRYQHLQQLESEFVASSDHARRHELARAIVALRAELGGRNVECERWLQEGNHE